MSKAVPGTAWRMLLIVAVLLCHERVTAQPPITAVAISPDGNRCVAASQAGVHVYRWPDLSPDFAVPTHVAHVHDLAFARSGSTLLIAGGVPADSGRVERVVVAAGKPSTLFEHHDDVVVAITWIGDHAFATASLDHDVALWDASTGERRQRLSGHSRGVTAVASVDGGRIVVSGGLDGNVRVWETATGKLLRTLNNHTGPLHDLATRPASDGLPMVATVAEDRTVRFWQPTIGRLVRFAQLNAQPLAIAWRPDGSQIAVTTTTGRLLLIDPLSASVVADYAAIDGWAYSIAAHPTDGSFLVGGQSGQLVRIETER